MKRQQDGDEGHGTLKSVQGSVQIERTATRNLVGRLLHSDLDIGIVHARTGQFQHGDDGVFIPGVNPKEIRTHGGGFLDLGGFGLGEGEELAEKRRLFSDGVPHRMDALNHACLS